MNFNIKHTMNNSMFERGENLRQSARQILKRQNASESAINSILGESIFEMNTQNNDAYWNQQFELMKAYQKINIKKSENKNQPATKHVLGELWNSVKNNNKEFSEDDFDIEINYFKSNIFAA